MAIKTYTLGYSIATTVAPATQQYMQRQNVRLYFDVHFIYTFGYQFRTKTQQCNRNYLQDTHFVLQTEFEPCILLGDTPKTLYFL